MRMLLKPAGQPALYDAVHIHVRAIGGEYGRDVGAALRIVGQGDVFARIVDVDDGGITFGNGRRVVPLIFNIGIGFRGKRIGNGRTAHDAVQGLRGLLDLRIALAFQILEEVLDGIGRVRLRIGDGIDDLLIRIFIFRRKLCGVDGHGCTIRVERLLPLTLPNDDGGGRFDDVRRIGHEIGANDAVRNLGAFFVNILDRDLIGVDGGKFRLDGCIRTHGRGGRELRVLNKPTIELIVRFERILRECGDRFSGLNELGGDGCVLHLKGDGIIRRAFLDIRPCHIPALGKRAHGQRLQQHEQRKQDRQEPSPIRHFYSSSQASESFLSMKPAYPAAFRGTGSAIIDRQSPSVSERFHAGFEGEGVGIRAGNNLKAIAPVAFPLVHDLVILKALDPAGEIHGLSKRHLGAAGGEDGNLHLRRGILDLGLRGLDAIDAVDIDIADQVVHADLHPVALDAENDQRRAVRDGVDDLAKAVGGDAQIGVALRGGRRLGGGSFPGGEFLGGEFLGGSFLSGEFLSGEFLSGKFLSGEFLGGEFLSGEFLSGEFLGGEFLGGGFLSREFLGREFLSREFLGRSFLGRSFLGGSFLGGGLRDGIG